MTTALKGPAVDRPPSATWPGHRSAKATKRSRVGAVRLALGLSRLEMSGLIGVTERTIHRAETDPGWQPRGLTRLALVLLEERLAAGDTAELKQLAQVAGHDPDALRLLFVPQRAANSKRKGRA
jgi:DNA-binding XRE family transcriptional regulator